MTEDKTISQRGSEHAVAIRGTDVIRNPFVNKGTAFSSTERNNLELEGLLPVQTKSIEQQAKRIYEQLRTQTDDLHKYVMLSALLNRNAYLFYRVLQDHLEELMPIVYTPTVGAAVQRFSRVWQGEGGIWITPDMKGRMESVLRMLVGDRDIRLLVVTDNESILGLGDQGAGGVAISIGKLALYTAAAGIDPAQAIPVSLDFGTDNAELLADEAYLGWPTRRLRGAEYLALVDEFVTAVKAVMPRALVQWEDFRKDNALAILDRYADVLPSFNDDIQGTGAVVMAGLNSALKIKNERLADQRIVVFGAGAAGLGVTRQIRTQLSEHGLSAMEQSQVVAVLDRSGLIVADGSQTDAYKTELAWSPALAAHYGLDKAGARSLLDVVREFKPTVLIGVSGVAGAFDERVVREMAKHTDRPIIFPSSNPSANSEARPADLYLWTDCRCLVATGSPFPDVECSGKRYRVGQGNNVFIFPGLGLAAIAANVRKVTDGMTNAASKALAALVTAEERESGLLFPSVTRLRAVSIEVAKAVVEHAVREGLADVPTDEIDACVRRAMWAPEYPTYRAG